VRKFVFLLLLLVSCQLTQPRAKIDIPPSVRVGTSALEIAFNPASTNSLFMCNPGELFVELRNTGAWNIEDGFYTWIDDPFLKLLSARQSNFSIVGKSQYNPVGGFTASTRLKFESLDLPQQLESYSSSLIFQACYPYRTWASVPVCVDPDVRGFSKNKPCKAEPVVLTGGQGAPVAITRVETVMVPTPDGKVRPSFAVFVQNLGYGSVVRESDVELACRSGKEMGREKLLPFADVYVELQEQPLKCMPVEKGTEKSITRIEAGVETTFVCSDPDMIYDMSAGTFSTVLTIELRYGYVNVAMFPVKVSQLPQQQPCSG
jgi:hypothetical protein